MINDQLDHHQTGDQAPAKAIDCDDRKCVNLGKDVSDHYR